MAMVEGPAIPPEMAKPLKKETSTRTMKSGKKAINPKDVNGKTRPKPKFIPPWDKVSDEPIETLAQRAAAWLTLHWPRESAKIGPALFAAQRENEILNSSFPDEYWEECELLEDLTAIGYPSCNPAAKQPPLKFETPGSLNSDCLYSTTEPSSGHASNGGHTNNDGYFVDDFLKQKNYIFEVKPPVIPCLERPAFSAISAIFNVSHAHQNAQAWSNLYKASWADARGNLSLLEKSVDQTARYYFFAQKQPVAAPGELTLTMTRDFVVDARYKAQADGYVDDDGGLAMVQVAPAPPRGKYRYKNLSTFTEQINDGYFFIAKPEEDEPIIPTKNGFVFECGWWVNSSMRWPPGSIPSNYGDREIVHIARPPGLYSQWSALTKRWNSFFPEDPFPQEPDQLPGHFTVLDWESKTGLRCYKKTIPLSNRNGWPDTVIHKFWLPPESERGGLSAMEWTNQKFGIDLDFSNRQMGYTLAAGRNGWRPINSRSELPPPGCCYHVKFLINKIQISAYRWGAWKVFDIYIDTPKPELPALECDLVWPPIEDGERAKPNRKHTTDNSQKAQKIKLPSRPIDKDTVHIKEKEGIIPAFPIELIARGKKIAGNSGKLSIAAMFGCIKLVWDEKLREWIVQEC